MNEQQIGVSVYCMVYNHEKYLRQCLDGFVMQETTFPFEVIVHDDASTDGSAQIIREYAEKYPDLIRPIYQTVNQYSQKVPITQTFLLPMVRGKYLACCEGDDYWCDPHKLQLQYDVMEEHPECPLCLHKVQAITEAGKKLQRTFPEDSMPGGRMSAEAFLSQVLNGYSFQTSCYFRRTADVQAYFANIPEFVKVADVGDEPALLYFGNLGDPYYLDRTMSCYRMQSVGSWSARMAQNLDVRIQHLDAMIKMYTLYDEYTGHRYSAMTAAAIKRMEMSKAISEMDDRAYARYILKKENRWCYQRYNFRGKVALHLQAYAPWLLHLYYQLKGNTQ